MQELLENSSVHIQEVRRLRKREYRMKTGRVIVEGYTEVSRAVKAGIKVSTLYICPEIFTSDGSEFKGLNTVEVNKYIFSQMAFGDRLKGILALCEPRQILLSDLLPLKKNPLIVLLEGVEKPGNLGAVLRTCDGAGVDAVIICDGKTDIYNHNVVRSSIATVFTVPVVSVSKEEAVSFLKENRVNIFVATSQSKHVFTDVDLTKGSAIVVGNEHTGVSLFWRDLAKEEIRIPMVGEAQCLNAAISASILVYEAFRQREK